MRLTIDMDLDPTAVSAALTAALGHPCSVLYQAPGQVVDGVEAPGILVPLDERTGKELADEAEERVRAVLAAQAPVMPRVDPLDALASALTDATTVAKLRGALATYVDEERNRREPESGRRSQ